MSGKFDNKCLDFEIAGNALIENIVTCDHLKHARTIDNYNLCTLSLLVLSHSLKVKQ